MSDNWTVTSAARTERQLVVRNWGEKAFGLPQMHSCEQRAIRLLEEAIELAQACSVPRGMCDRLVSYVYARPTGNPIQELGGVSVTLLAMASTLGVTAEAVEVAEVQRVLSKSPEFFAARNQQKNDDGFIASDLR